MSQDTIRESRRAAMASGLQLVRKAIVAFGRNDMGTITSAISFLALFALLSAVSAFVAFYGIFGDPKLVVSEMKALSGFVPADVIISMIGQMHSVATRATVTLLSAGSFSLIIAVWCAQQGVAMLFDALSAAYHVEPADRFWPRFWRSLFSAMAIIAGLSAATLLAIGLPLWVEVITQPLWIAESVRVGSMTLAGVVLFAGLVVIYRLVPRRSPPKWRWISGGAGLVVGFWTGASVLFSIFLAYYDSYVTMYGSLSGVVLLLTLTYITVASILIGAEFNAQMEFRENPVATEVKLEVEDDGRS